MPTTAVESSAVTLTGVAAIAALGGGYVLARAHDAAPSPAEQWPLFGEYCIDCHNRDDFTAEIAFDRMSRRVDRARARDFRSRRAQAARRADAAARRAAARQRRRAAPGSRGLESDARCGRRGRSRIPGKSRCTA